MAPTIAPPGEPAGLEPALARSWDPGVEVVVRPVRSRIRLRDLPQMRAVIGVLAMRDFKAKFKQSALGPVWIVLQPVLLLFAFLIGFHSVADVGTDGVPFGVLCEMLATYDDPDGAAARGAGYLHGWITTGLLTDVSVGD